MTETPAAHDRDRRLALLREHLAGADDRCPVCDYHLRDLQALHCPECGAALELRVGSRDLHLVPWLVALLSVALPLGFVVIFLAISVVVEFVPAVSAPPGAILAFSIPTLFYVVVLHRLIAKRRWFWQRARAAQIRIAAAIVAAGTIAIGATLAWMFHF